MYDENQVREMVGRNLAAFRAFRGKTGLEVATDLGIDNGTLSYYEAGKRKMNTDLMVMFANYYDVTLAQLVTPIV